MSFSILVNQHGFAWDAGNRYTYTNLKDDNGKWENLGGHLWQTGTPTIPGNITRKSPYLNPNTGKCKNGKWVHITEDEFDTSIITHWTEVGEWCDVLHELALSKL